MTRKLVFYKFSRLCKNLGTAFKIQMYNKKKIVENTKKGDFMKKILVFSIFLFISIFIISNFISIAIATSKYGSSGTEVKQIQQKLKNWGYYNGSVDGIYGSQTVAAVKKFQSKNGLTADGVAGPKTLAALGINSSSSSSGSTSSNNSDLNLLSHLVYGEARGEIYKGQVAVAATVLNRVSDSRFPSTVAGVIYQSGAYTAVADGQINLSPDSTAKKAAQDALNGWDPSLGSIYYFNPNTATSKWIWSRPQVITIGKHIFCK